MNTGMKRGPNRRTTHCGVEALSFGILSSDEIHKSSVLKVSTPLSFNQYGRPLPGGLYDPLLGPTAEKGALCATCSSNSFQCSGHMGHIELPVPVVNPVFRRALCNILRISCVKCFKTQIPDFAKYLLLARLRLLDMGLSTAAMEAEREVSNPNPDLKDNEALAIWAKEKLEEYIETVSKKEGIEKEVTSSQAFEALRRLFVDTTLRSVANSKKCCHCKMSLKRFMLYQCRFVTMLSKVEVAQKFNEGSSGVEDTTKGRSKGTSVTVRADELRSHMRNIWAVEQDIAEALFPVLKRPDMEFPTDLFFIDTIPVTPPNSRPVNHVNGAMVDNPQSFSYKQVLQDVVVIQSVVKAMQDGTQDNLNDEGKLVLEQLRGASLLEKLSNCWDELQADVDHLLDKDINKATNASSCIGLKQIIEKKEGLFRMHMMGKRVNYAARSVITPDPNLNVDEIGIPEEFAKRLTYPTPVTPWNVDELRKMVLNGPKVHPGAVMVENEDGMICLLKDENPSLRQAIAKRLLTPSGRCTQAFSGAKIVHRHLCNGDVLLLNRQPTLHRPSIMAHKARVLKGEKTIRLHYANCSSYNADFDGDEMNAHFPQNELARSEGYNLVNVCYQYLVPKNGTPISGLIQDHVISGVKLTTRGRFFTREQYQQLVYQGLSSMPGTIRLLPPSILKPVCLWSGKQVLSTVLLNVIPRDKPPITLEASAKISAKAWERQSPRPCSYGGSPLTMDDMSEAQVVIREGELLSGVLDKKHYGATPYGLVHCVYELYGGQSSAHLLSALAKLFTAFLQTEGFTLGVADILVLSKADKKRSSLIKQARQIGDHIVKEALELPSTTSEKELKIQMKIAFDKDVTKYRATLDRKYKSTLDQVTNEINKSCLPVGLVHKFPENNLQLMVQSGAKGSAVNTMQISCLLGQIELEGKRPPLMISGKSLPCFAAFDTSPRAGGFVDGRFMSGIRPQEFFFHCMAGREGLIDTAVKTSRSGYLQRCLVKHLEGLVVSYDQTVRDSDGSIIQFYYGEDGMDVCKAQFLNQEQIHVLTDNSGILISGKDTKKLQEMTDLDALASAKKEVTRWRKKNIVSGRQRGFVAFSKELAAQMEDMEVHLDKDTGRTNIATACVEAWRELDPKSRRSYEKVGRHCPDPVSSKFRLDRDFGALSETLEALIEAETKRGGKEKEEALRELVYHKSMAAQCPPGDPVGVLAAQSIGEPSTQMTLNTFHFAGRGDMNVTLGIPRLREVLMLASKNQSTPAMDIPFLPGVSESKAERLRLRLTKVTVADVLHKISVSEKIDIGMTRQYTFKIRFSFLPRSAYKSKYPLKPKNILKYMELSFFHSLEVNMKKAMKLKTETISSQPEMGQRRRGVVKEGEEEDEDEPAPAKSISMADGEGHESSDEDEQAEDEDATMARRRSRHTENKEYEDPEEGEAERESDVENDDDDAMSEAPTEATEDMLPETAEQLLEDPAFCDFSARIQQVKSTSSYIQSYQYDMDDELWCEIIMGISLDLRKVDMSTILRETANKAVIWQVPRINKAFTYRNANQELVLKVDGINIPEMCKHHKLLNLNRLYTNDIHAFTQVYGIEAASRVLVKEVQDVFQVYGITVDPRHLLLIADYMTCDGTYRAMNRAGFNNSVSPLQQMTFETSLSFLRTAILNDKKDYIKSPSSCLVAGQPCRVGTGAFGLRLKMTA